MKKFLLICHLQDADQRAEVSKPEKEEILAKFSQAEKMLEEWKSRVHKLEEDNAKVWRSHENSIKILNRMSMDSKNHVDKLVGLIFELNYCLLTLIIILLLYMNTLSSPLHCLV